MALFCASRLAVASDVGMPQPLTEQAGDPARGQAIATNPRLGLCVLCHAVAGEPPHGLGNIAASLDGAGSRWSAAQLRARLVDARQFNPASVMPAFHPLQANAQGGQLSDQRIGRRWQNQPILSAQELEDVLAWLVTLK